MKKLLFVLIALLIAFPAIAEQSEEVSQIKACPVTMMQKDCLACHVAGNFKVKETAPDATLVYPVPGMRLLNDKGYLLLIEMESESVRQFLEYLTLHKVHRAVIEIHSCGGALFEAQRIIGLIQVWQARNGKIETHLYGTAFSAGFYVFLAGDKRFVAPDCDIMWHEIQSFSGFGVHVTTPSDNEEASRVLRHLQNVRNNYIASRGKLSKDEIDKKVAKREWWMTGRQLVEYGFADGFIR